MVPGLSDRDRDRFENLHETLAGVSQVRNEDSSIESSPGPLDPMLATSFRGDLDDISSDEWIAEPKYDGTRLVLEKFDGTVYLYTRRHVERSSTLPELTNIAESILPDGIILDGEYTFQSPDGTSQFVPIHAGDERIQEEALSPSFYVFDILALNNEWCTRKPLMDRKQSLTKHVSPRGILSVVQYQQSDFREYYDDLVAAGEEGIILKRRGSAYHLGTRSDHWRKVKDFTETDVVVVGYTPGEGRRKETFGALVMTDGDRYIGRVGSGFDDQELHSLLELMTPVEDQPVPEAQVGMPYTPVEPFVAEVKYQEVTDSGELRAPVFLRVRPDKPLDDVVKLT